MGMHRLLLNLRGASALVTCAAAWALTGCAAAPGGASYGNHAAASSAFDQKVAADSIKQLVTLYPPASTRFNVAQATADAFGTALVAGLREKGFAVMEFQAAPTATRAAGDGDGTRADGVHLRYLLDQSATDDLYRVTLAVAHQQLSRAYMIHNGNPHAAGAWVRKE